MGCQYCGGALMRLDSLPSYTYCTSCKRRPDPLPISDRPLVDPETGETPPPPPRAIVPADLLGDLAPYLEPDDAA